jgi:hypothetical protein
MLKVTRPPSEPEGLLGAFGEGCPKGLVIWAVMQLSHFLGYFPDHFFNSIH